MKNISEYIKCGKNINEAYLIKKHQNAHKSILYIPIFNENFTKARENYKLSFKEWNKINIKPGNYFIYNDKYRRKKHLGTFNDMTSNIGFNYDDFEDFSEKDIIATFDTLKDACIYILKDLKYTDEDIKLIENDEESYSPNDAKGYYDSINYIFNVIKGNEDESYYSPDDENYIIDALEESGWEISNLPDEWQKLTILKH